MSKEVAATSNNLPAGIANMKTAIAASISTTGASAGNDQYAGMDRYGTHYYGAERTEIEKEDRWLVNLNGIQHGWTAWGTEAHGTKGQNVGEVMVPLAQPSPLESDLPEVKGNWTKCVSIQMRCVEGEDKGVQILWKSNSYGGRKAYTELMLAVQAQLDEDPSAVFPIICLDSDSYVHKEYGKIFAPIFEIVDWSDNSGETPAPEKVEAKVEPAAEPAEAEEAPAAEDKPPRRRRRKAA